MHRPIESSPMLDGSFQEGSSISFRDVVFRGFHGVLPQEKVLGQEFVVDLDAWVPRVPESTATSAPAPEAVFKLVQSVVEGPSWNLLEAVACDTAAQVLSSFPEVTRVRVRLKKPQVAVPQVLDFLGVEIVRERGSPLDGSDKLLMQGLVCYGRHGMSLEEIELGQKFTAHVEAWCPLSRAGATDDLTHTVNYAEISRLAAETISGDAQCTTLHDLASRIGEKVFNLSPLITKALVSLSKQHSSRVARFSGVGVAICRQ